MPTLENAAAETNTTQPEQPSPASGATWREYVGRARALAKEHPTAVLVVAAGAGVLFAAEFTVGALAGIGAAMLLSKKSGPELREQIRHRSDDLLKKTREQGERLFEQGKKQGEQLLHRGRALWPFPRKVDEPHPRAGDDTSG